MKISATQLASANAFLHGENVTPTPIPDDNPTGAASTISFNDPGFAVYVHTTGTISHPSTVELRAELRNGSGVFPLTLKAATGTFDVRTVLPGGFPAAGPWQLVVIDQLPTHTGQIEHWSLDLQAVSVASRTTHSSISLAPHDAKRVFGTFELSPIWSDPVNYWGPHLPHPTKVSIAPSSQPLLADFDIEVQGWLDRVTFSDPSSSTAVGDLEENPAVGVVKVTRRGSSTTPFPASVDLMFQQD